MCRTTSEMAKKPAWISQRFLLFVGWSTTLIMSGLTIPAAETSALSAASSDFETVHTSNAAILNRLGLSPLRIPNGHHKKRLSGPEPFGLSTQTRIHQPYSRRHSHHDSHVYVIKLPASSPYYTITKPHKSFIKDNKTSSQTKTTFHPNNSPVEFHSNGKPAKIYHWNLPVVKKITEKQKAQAQLRMEQQKKRYEEMERQKQQHEELLKTIKKTSHASLLKEQKIQQQLNDMRHHSSSMDNSLISGSEVIKHVRNNDKRLSYRDEDGGLSTVTRKSNNGNNKTYRLDDSTLHRLRLATNELPERIEPAATSKLKKHRKKAAMSYYAPIAVKTTSIHKNFPGNGKPKAFYVMEKSRKPVYYHPLLP